jgi:hypothetical protein
MEVFKYLVSVSFQIIFELSFFFGIITMKTAYLRCVFLQDILCTGMILVRK